MMSFVGAAKLGRSNCLQFYSVAKIHTAGLHACSSLSPSYMQMVLDLTGLALYDSILLLDDSYSMTAAEGCASFPCS